jgi:hypothetical protein
LGVGIVVVMCAPLAFIVTAHRPRHRTRTYTLPEVAYRYLEREPHEARLIAERGARRHR